MTYEELNKYMKNYVENDITGRAIMLTSAWGSGKSYYVKKYFEKAFGVSSHTAMT